MILSARTQNPVAQLGLFLSVWIWVVVRVFSVDAPSAAFPFIEPLSNLLFNYLPTNSIGNKFLFIIVVAVQSVYVSYILQKHNLIERNNWIPGIIYLFLISISPANLALSPVIVANLFLLLLMDRLFESYDSIKGIDNVMLAGLYASLSIFFYFPSVLFILSVWLGLFVLRHLNWRYFVVSFIGIFIPLLYIGTWFFITDKFQIELSAYQFFFKQIFLQISFPTISKPVLLVVYLLLMISSILFIVSHLQEKLIKIRKKNSIIIVLSVMSLLSIILSYTPFVQSISLISLMLSVSVSIYVIEMKRELISTLILWILFAFSIVSNLGII
jgi:hypothetical protein